MTDHDIPPVRGTYALILASELNLSIRVGALGKIELCPGFYIYVGSAFGPGGLRARISRHMKRSKKLHWHVDYLRAHMRLTAVCYDGYPAVQEHNWSYALQKSPRLQSPFPRFGASDCSCVSHLFYSETVQSSSALRELLEFHTDPGLKFWRQEDSAR